MTRNYDIELDAILFKLWDIKGAIIFCNFEHRGFAMVDDTCDFNPELAPLMDRFVTVLQEMEKLSDDRKSLELFIYDLDSLLKSDARAREVMERNMVEINERACHIVKDVISLNTELTRLKKEEKYMHSLMERSKGELRKLEKSLQAKDNECIALMEL